ncbi:MAG: phosphatidylserine decarboxylase family protein [Acidobacteria bacterium]|nr:phosphatidylserine decarboxylase family protein [Acidobacteriota bacterium]
MLRDAYTFIVPLVILSVVCLLLGWLLMPAFFWVAGVLLFLALFVAFFFRNPEREISTDEKTIVSPADGLIVVLKPVDPHNDQAGTLISIFLSIFDVHVNRSPLAGTITSYDYRPGKFLVASAQRASIENEQTIITVENRHAKVVFKQIAGLIARRIVFWNKVGDTIKLGERVGYIKFGSRVDVIVPPQVKVLVKKGQRTKGGVTVLGKVSAGKDSGEKDSE